MKRVVLYGLLGLLAYGLFLLFQFPAATLVGWLTPQLPGLQIAQVQGSIREGSVRDLTFKDARLAALNWRWRPQALLQGRLEYRLRGSDPGLSLDVLAGMSVDRRLRLSALQGRLPLARAAAFAGDSSPLLDGELELALDTLMFNQTGHPLAARGEVYLRNTRTVLGISQDLGDFKAVLSTEETGILAQIQDMGGPLELNGNLTLAADASYRLSARLGVRDPDNKTLRQTLGILGRPDQEGKWNIDFTGRL